MPTQLVMNWNWLKPSSGWDQSVKTHSESRNRLISDWAHFKVIYGKAPRIISSFQSESTQDVWVRDKIAHVGVNQHCALTRMLKTSFLYFPSGLENSDSKIKAHANEHFFFHK